MLSTTKHILNYINKTIDTKNINKWLYDNELLNTVGGYYDSCAKSAEQFSLLNTLATQKNSKQLFKVCEIFDTNDIDYITFKGVVLSCRLYNNPYLRLCGDIDIFVNNKNFNSALELLLTNGYTVDSVSNLKNEHHIVLNNGITKLELHKNILNPFTKINETYMQDHTENVVISNQKIRTFDITTTLLHLFYHLYMDTCLSSNNIYAISTNKRYGIAKRFLYRAYEIASFAEKYFKDIKWNDIISDIKTQKLRIVFKYMVEDILEIFPNAFPAKLVDAINSLEYVGQQNDDVYKIIRTAKAAHDNNVDLVLSKYIDENWNCNNTATCKHLGECFEISKPVGEEPCKNKTLSCELLIDRCKEGISLQFTVSDDDFYVSDYNNFGTLESDGVHLLLCGTQKYTYMSIFLVPKIKNDSIEVFAYDVLNNTMIDSMDIQARIQKYDDYYILQAVLSNEFLSKHEIDKYFYAGFVISDCDRETKYRKNALVSAEPATEWYNPLHFLKIDLLHY